MSPASLLLCGYAWACDEADILRVIAGARAELAARVLARRVGR